MANENYSLNQFILTRDYFNEIDVPNFILCKGNRDAIGVIKCFENQKMSMNLDINEISFSTYMYINGEYTSIYNEITELKYIYVEGFGHYIITSVDEEDDGVNPKKTVTAKSEEYNLGQRYLEEFYINTGEAFSKDNVVLYNENKPKESLLNLVIAEKCPEWHIGEVDPSIASQKRYFEIDRTDIFSFLKNDVQESFDCVVLFDTLNMAINVYANENFGNDITQQSGTFITFDNLMKTTNFSSSLDDIKTCLTVTGADDIDLRDVNMGSDKIYNFDYYASTEYMSPGLVDAYNAWKQKIANNMAAYTGYRKNYREEVEKIYYLTNEKMPRGGNNLIDIEGSERLAINGLIVRVDNITTSVHAATNMVYISGTATADTEIVINNHIDDYLEVGTTYRLIGCPTQTSTSVATADYYLKWYDPTNLPAAVYDVGGGADIEFTAGRSVLSIFIKNGTYCGEEELFKELTFDPNIYDPRDDTNTDWLLYGLKPLEEKKAIYENKQAVCIKAGQANPSNSEYESIYLPIFYNLNGNPSTGKVGIKQAIELTEEEIFHCQVAIGFIEEYIDEICNECSMDNNFTVDQQIELNKFVREDQVSSENYVITDSMTEEERFQMLDNMYEYANKELVKVSQPQIQFSSDIVNLFNMLDYYTMSLNFTCGNYVTVLLRDDYSVQARLLSFDIDFLNLDTLSVTFGNVNKLKSKSIFADITKAINTSTSVSTTVSIKSSTWNNAVDLSNDNTEILNNGVLGQTSLYFNSTIDEQQQENTNVGNVSLDKRGLLITSPDNDDAILIGGSQIVFSDDNLKTVKEALGRFTFYNRATGETEEVFGLNAQVVQSGYIEGSTIVGSNIIVGGSGIADPYIVMLDENNVERGRWDKNGLVVADGYAQIPWDSIVDPPGLADLDDVGITNPSNGQMLTYDSASNTWVNVNSIQVSSMPTASAGEVGKIYQYIGATDSNYTNGYFYKCISSSPEPTYEDPQGNMHKYYTVTAGDYPQWAWYKIYADKKLCYCQVPNMNTYYLLGVTNFSFGQEVGEINSAGGTTVARIITYYPDYGHENYDGDYMLFNWDNTTPTRYNSFRFTEEYLDPNIYVASSLEDAYAYLTREDYEWIRIDVQPSGSASALTDLTDTNIDNPTNGQALVYNNGEWINTDVVTESIQVEELPTASESEVGKIYQYIGATDNNYTNGYFYKCMSSSLGGSYVAPDGNSYYYKTEFEGQKGSGSATKKYVFYSNYRICGSKEDPGSSAGQLDGSYYLLVGCIASNGNKILVEMSTYQGTNIVNLDNTVYGDGTRVPTDKYIGTYDNTVFPWNWAVSLYEAEFTEADIPLFDTNEEAYEYATQEAYYWERIDVQPSGGNVEDVYVNGTSVLDSDKIAQITSYKEVTQAEYDALPSSKLTDGIAYFIKDATTDMVVLDVKIDGVSIVNSDGYANFYTMIGATAQADGTTGLVPAPTSADKDKYLKGDGTWASVQSGASAIDDLTNVNISNPADGQVLKYDATNEEWVNGTGGGSGSGNVDDVYVNGSSVLDSNHIAQVKSYVELTQAEYDALPASKLTDDILYCISDSGIVEGDQFSPVIYSLDEREVGVWTDGKPLYQKTLYVDQITTTGEHRLNHNIANIGNVASIVGKCKYNNQDETLPLPYMSSNVNYGIMLGNVTSTTYFIGVGNGFTSLQDIYVTLRYTKTTDVPGSGQWRNDGVPMAHYDGSEKVIGTYFGETLYEKSYFIANPVSSNPGSGTPDFQMTTVQDLSLSNIDTLVSINGSWTRHSDYSGNILEINYPINSWETTNIFKSLVRVCSTSSSQSDIGLSYCIYVGNYTSAKNLSVTIQYTKKS